MDALRKAATGALNLGVVGVATLGAVAVQSWSIAAVGVLTYGALVAWDFVRAREGGGGGDSGSADQPKTALEKPDKYKDPQTHGTVRSILGAKSEVDRVLADVPDDVRNHLALAMMSVDSLMERAASLAARSEELSRYLATKDPRVVKYDVDLLRERVARASDPEARSQYASALASRQEHLQALVDLGNARERAVASMISIASCLEALPAKIVHMRALDADAMDKMGGDVNGELGQVNEEMRAVEEALRTMGDVRE